MFGNLSDWMRDFEPVPDVPPATTIPADQPPAESKSKTGSKPGHVRPKIAYKALKQFGCAEVEIVVNVGADEWGNVKEKTDMAVQIEEATHPDLFKQFLDLGYEAQDGSIFVRRFQDKPKDSWSERIDNLTVGKSYRSNKYEMPPDSPKNRRSHTQQQGYISRLAQPRKKKEQPPVKQSTPRMSNTAASELVQRLYPKKKEKKVDQPPMIDGMTVDEYIDKIDVDTFTPRPQKQTRTTEEQVAYASRLAVPREKKADPNVATPPEKTKPIKRAIPTRERKTVNNKPPLSPSINPKPPPAFAQKSPPLTKHNKPVTLPSPVLHHGAQRLSPVNRLTVQTTNDDAFKGCKIIETNLHGLKSPSGKKLDPSQPHVKRNAEPLFGTIDFTKLAPKNTDDDTRLTTPVGITVKPWTSHSAFVAAGQQITGGADSKDNVEGITISADATGVNDIPPYLPPLESEAPPDKSKYLKPYQYMDMNTNEDEEFEELQFQPKKKQQPKSNPYMKRPPSLARLDKWKKQQELRRKQELDEYKAASKNLMPKPIVTNPVQQSTPQYEFSDTSSALLAKEESNLDEEEEAHLLQLLQRQEEITRAVQRQQEKLELEEKQSLMAMEKRVERAKLAKPKSKIPSHSASRSPQKSRSRALLKQHNDTIVSALVNFDSKHYNTSSAKPSIEESDITTSSCASLHPRSPAQSLLSELLWMCINICRLDEKVDISNFVALLRPWICVVPVSESTQKQVRGSCAQWAVRLFGVSAHVCQIDKKEELSENDFMRLQQLQRRALQFAHSVVSGEGVKYDVLPLVSSEEGQRLVPCAHVAATTMDSVSTLMQDSKASTEVIKKPDSSSTYRSKTTSEGKSSRPKLTSLTTWNFD